MYIALDLYIMIVFYLKLHQVIIGCKFKESETSYNYIFQDLFWFSPSL